MAEKAQRSKPWLLHPLKSSLRGRYIFIYDVIFFFEFMKQLNDILIQMPQLAYGWQFPFGDFFIFHLLLFVFIVFFVFVLVNKIIFINVVQVLLNYCAYRV